MSFEPIDVTKLELPKKGPRKSKINIDERTLQTWWKIMHNFGECVSCNAVRMVADIHDRKLCRHCFLGGK